MGYTTKRVGKNRCDHGKNWFGGYLNNSAFILGIAIGFYATKVVYGITALGIIATLYAIIIVALKNKRSEAM